MFEFLFSISDCIKQDILTKVHKSSTISIMADESNGMAILKQLVVYGRAVVDGKFLGIQKCNLDICMTLDLTSTMYLILAVFVPVL